MVLELKWCGGQASSRTSHGTLYHLKNELLLQLRVIWILTSTTQSKHDILSQDILNPYCKKAHKIHEIF